MFYVNVGNKSIYTTQVVGSLPSPQGDSSTAITADLTTYPPVKRSALSVVTAPTDTLWYPVNTFRWQDATSVSVSKSISAGDLTQIQDNGVSSYAVFGPEETRSDAEIVVERLRARGVTVAVRTGTVITGDNDRGVFDIQGFPTGDVVVVSEFSDNIKFNLEEVTRYTPYRTFVIDDRDASATSSDRKFKVVTVGDPGVAGLPLLINDPAIYRVVDDVVAPPRTNTQQNDNVQPKPDSQPSTQPTPDGGSGDGRGDGGEKNQVNRYEKLMAGPRETVKRHGTVSSLLTVLNSGQHYALRGNAAVRASLIEQAIADADVINTDVITVSITYPIKADVYVDEELGQRYDRYILLDDQFVRVSVVKRMSRARRFMSWFIVPTAITAGVVAIVKDSLTIGRGRV